MPRCKWCEHNITAADLCSTCHVLVSVDAQQHMRIMQESEHLADFGKTLKTRVGRCGDVIAHASALLPYELKGINVMDPPPSQVIRTFQGKRKVVIVEGILQEIRDAREKAGMATTTTRSKLAQYTKVLQIIRDYKNEYPDLPVLARSESTVVRAMADLQLAAYLQEAEKAEIKGNRKKALDQYYEAMYFLQHDNVDDKLQAAQLTRIEAKIKELSSAGP